MNLNSFYICLIAIVGSALSRPRKLILVMGLIAGTLGGQAQALAVDYNAKRSQTSFSKDTQDKFASSFLQSICDSPEPVLIIDNFPAGVANSSKSQSVTSQMGPIEDSVDVRSYNFNQSEVAGRIVDVDGDLIPDMYHGEFVEALLQSDGFTTKRVNILGIQALPDLVTEFQRLVQQIRSQNLKFSRINISQENPLKIAAFKSDLFPTDKSVPEITAQNIKEYSSKILSHIWQNYPDLKVRELYLAFETIRDMGIPVVVAAGNFGPGYVNLFSMMPGVTTVGSLNFKGQKLISSSNNAFVTEWRRGEVVPVVVVDGEKGIGVDINEDRKLDIFRKNISNEPSVVEYYSGKLPSEIVSIVDPEFNDYLKKNIGSGLLVPNAAINSIAKGVYRVSDIVMLPTITSGTANMFLSLGTYILKIEFGKPYFFFEEDDNGRLIFDPRGSGEPHQLNRIPGTSFAAPLLCEVPPSPSPS